MAALVGDALRAVNTDDGQGIGAEMKMMASTGAYRRMFKLER